MRLGNIQKALNCIQTALDISAPDRNLMTFARSGTILDKILSLAEPAYTDTVAQIAEIRSRYLPEAAESLKPAASISLEEKFRNLPEPLTDREIEIAKLAAEGMRNKEIAAMLFLSERTVSNRLYTIFQKLNIDRRSELIDFIKEAE
jgi:LuxR family maltose regulon positive regulatory protein